MTNELNLSWIAGFWEGEGSAGRYKCGDGERRLLEVTITQKNAEILYRIKAFLVEYAIDSLVMLKKHDCHVLRMRSGNAKLFLLTIYPYLKFKQDKVKALII